MKKIALALFILLSIFICQVQVFAIEVQPTFFSKTKEQDRVWVGTFQLVWNDFIDKIVFNPVRFREGNPTLVNELNKQYFTADDLSEKSFYKYAGRVKKNTKKHIAKAIKKKFNESSDLLDKLDLNPRNDMFLIYAMLKKDFEFLNEFDKLGKSLFGKEQVAEYFGIDKNSKSELDKGVNVLFYNSYGDFAVSLLTKDEEEVFLYKNSSNKPFNYIYTDMLKKQNAFSGKTKFQKIDELKVPNISLFEEKSFDELVNRRIMGTNFVINQAMETIRFDMTSKGVKLKSEAAMTVMTTSLNPEEITTPRYFYFDDTFVIFLKEKDKKKPYFALRVHDISNYQK